MQGGAHIKLNKAAEHLPTAHTGQFKGFDIPQEQLYVLTGCRPECNNKTIRKGVAGPHLRFVFSEKNDNYQHTILMLQFYKIKYCDELYKPEHNQYCITVDCAEFERINDLFSKDKASIREGHQLPLSYDKLTPQQRLWLMNVIFCIDTFTKLEQRYAEFLASDHKYSFDTLMAFHQDFVKSNALCIEYLQEKKTVNESCLPDPATCVKAITPRLDLQSLSSFTTSPETRKQNKRARLTSST